MEEKRSDESIKTTLRRLRGEMIVWYRHALDYSTPFILRRWIGTSLVALNYVLRIYFGRDYHVVSYGLATYILNLFIGFLSPKIDPEIDVVEGSCCLSRDGDEFKPFVRRLPEFRFWYSVTKAFVVAFLLTFISVLDVPVFWPVLVCYWFVLFVLAMKRQILHMIKYKYVPFDFRKQRYDEKKPEFEDSAVENETMK